MRARICNRILPELAENGKPQFVLPADGWYHIEVSGEHPNRAAGVTQVIDDAAVESIVRNFDPGESGMLIDQDHFSHDPEKPTTAYGWLDAVQDRGGELYGKIRWTRTGAPAVTGGDLRFFSTEYNPDSLERLDNKRVRPLRLDGLTLTNRPNNKGGKPISNRERRAGTARPTEKSGGSNPAAAPTTKKATMKNTAKALGLNDDATEGDILAEITRRSEENTTLKNRVTELEGDLEEIRNREVDGLMEEHAAVIGDDEEAKAFWRGGLINNREITEKQLKNLAEKKTAAEKAASAVEPLHNRATAKAPAPVEGSRVTDKEAGKTAAAIRNRAHAIVASENLPYPQAFDRAKAELAD